MIDHQGSTADTNDDPAKKPYTPIGGEDEGGASQNGEDEHLHEDQKQLASPNEVGADDPQKTEKLTRAGRDFDPDEGSE